MKKLKKLLALGLSLLMVCGGLSGVKSQKTNATDYTNVCSWSRNDTNDVISSGYTQITNLSSKSGYRQDAGTANTNYYIGIYNKNTAIFKETPSSATIDCKIGGGSANTTLSSSIYGIFLGNTGNEIGNPVEITKKITSVAGDSYSISMDLTGITEVYGVKIYHTKTVGYNCRFFSFSLSYSSDSTVQSISISGDSNIMVGQEASAFTHTLANLSGTPIYSSSNTDVADFDSESGLLVGKTEGTTLITATIGSTSSDPFTVRVWPSNTNEIVLSKCISIAETAGTTNSAFKYSARGTITAMSAGTSATTYTITDTTGSINVFAYNNTISSLNLAEGDKILVNGYLINYGGTTPQFNTPSISVIYTVTFKVNGTTYDTKEVAGGNTLTEIEEPEALTSMQFTGWKTSSGDFWDFENDTVTSDIELTATFVKSALITELNNTTAVKSLGFKYTTSTETINGYSLATNTADINVGDSIIYACKVNDTVFTLGNTINNKAFSNNPTITSCSEISDADASLLTCWTVENGTNVGFISISTMVESTKYYASFSSGDCSLVTESNKNSSCDIKVLSESTFLYLGNTSNNRGLIGRYLSSNYIFKNYATSNFGTSNYASSCFIYVKHATPGIVYKDVDFRVRIGVTGLDSLANQLTDDVSSEYGIKLTITSDNVTETNKIRYYNFANGSYNCEEGNPNIYYCVLSLGDVLNNISRITDEFKIEAYAKYYDTYYIPTDDGCSSTFSIKSLLEAYGNPSSDVSTEETREAVSDVCDIIESLGIDLDLGE